ncbi:MAG TPA: transcription elongation factor GreA [Candidatus Sulfotelmatobacter sp.]|nr:transcription elongation factor GreA [Candidatus Sulfotelmatobacter sp.]
MSPRVPALELLRGQGLLPDGPLLFGQPLPTPRSGVYVIEWPTAEPTVPVDHNLLREWLAHVPMLRVDGAPPTPHELAARLGAYWLPDQTVVYIGRGRSLRRRLADYAATPLGDDGPHHGGHWLKTLRGYTQARVWWAETDAPEEYEDALLTAFGEAIGRPGALPFANLRSLGSGARSHGITGAARAASPAALATPPAAGSGARRSAPSSTVTRRPSPSPRQGTATPRRAPGPPHHHRQPHPVVLTAEGHERLRSELDELHATRPDVIGRVKAARELGDLRENAEYQAAREEQSFLEGRIQQLQATLDRAVVSEVPAEDGLARVGSTVEVVDEIEDSPEPVAYTLVDPAEARLSEGRLSYRSPIGAALLGRRTGEVVTVTTPAGPRTYRVIAVR